MIQLDGRALLLLIALTCGGCGLLTPQPDTTRFAVLASVDELDGAEPPPAQAASALQVGLGPIVLPEYLLRAAVVTRQGGTRLVPSPTERWAEPFDRSVERVMAIDLQRALGTGMPVLHPWYETDRPEIQIELAFSRCERDANGTVVVACRWIVRRLDGSRAPIERETREERPVAGEDAAAVAKALSEVLAELSQEIAAAIREGAASGD